MIRKTAAAALLACALPAHAVDGISYETGGGDGMQMWRLGAQWNWEKKWFAGRRWNIVAFWDFTAGVWDSPENTVTDLGVTPTFRLQQREFSPIAPYMDAAIGFHILSKVRVSSRKYLGTNFQFGDHLGVGVRFGQGWRYDIGLRLQHLSNGGLSKANPGVNFVQLRLAYHFP